MVIALVILAFLAASFAVAVLIGRGIALQQQPARFEDEWEPVCVDRELARVIRIHAEKQR